MECSPHEPDRGHEPEQLDVSMRVERNEVVALLGRNGAGKSTTLKSPMGVVTPRTGSISV
jgi:branched-chain amino acid transport system ATP-binding protein